MLSVTVSDSQNYVVSLVVLFRSNTPLKELAALTTPYIVDMLTPTAFFRLGHNIRLLLQACLIGGFFTGLSITTVSGFVCKLSSSLTSMTGTVSPVFTLPIDGDGARLPLPKTLGLSAMLSGRSMTV